MGRFETAKTQVSLGWVSMGPLLAAAPQQLSSFSTSTPLLPLVVSQMRAWILRKASEMRTPVESNSVVLLGIDCWGAVIASQLSIMTGWRNFCLAGRGGGAHHTTFERVTPRVIREINAASVVIFVTDAIASGNTLIQIKDEINQKRKLSGLRPGRRKIRWLAAAILCDETTERGKDLDFIEAIGCACKKLRIPLLDPACLPAFDILPATLKFTCNERDSIVPARSIVPRGVPRKVLSKKKSSNRQTN
jgi:hypothetical protein